SASPATPPAPPVAPTKTPTLPPPSTALEASTPSTASSSPSALAKTLTENPSNKDNDARQAPLEEHQKRHPLGTIPVALGGIAEGIGNAAKPFGGEGAKNAVESVEKEMEQGKEQRLGQVETNIKNDPNSDVSKAYRQMVLEIAPDLAKQKNFQTMTAQE